MQIVMNRLQKLGRWGQKLGPYLMLELLLPGGRLVCAGANDDGAASLEKEAKCGTCSRVRPDPKKGTGPVMLGVLSPFPGLRAI